MFHLRFDSLLVVTLLVLAHAFTGATGSRAAEPAVPVFKDGEAQVVKAFEDADYWIRHDLWVETEFDSDGDGKRDRMHVSVTRPRQTESEGLKLPVVYVSSPYFAGTGSKGLQYFWNPRHELGATPPEREHFPAIERTGLRPIISKSHEKDWVPRGYIVVHSSSPGTGLSQGCPTVGGDNESLAPKAVIDWLCGRAHGFTTPDGDQEVVADWCTGKVGMTGTSYNGTIPLAAATTGVEGLEAIIPVAPNTSYYHYYRSNGLIRHPFGFLGEDIDYLYDYIHSGNPDRCDYCDDTVRDKEMAEGFDREHGDYNDFWAGRDYLNDLEPLTAAVLMAHAFNDWNVVPEHSVRIYQALKAKGVPTQVFFHQGGHGGPPPMKMMNRWFTRYLHGIENDVEKDPKAWIVREDAEQTKPTPYDDYPNPAAEPVQFYLTAGAPEQGRLTTAATANQGTESLVDNFSFSGASLAQAEWTDHRLIYVTPPLTKPVHLSGTPSISIKLASNKAAANLSVWLVSLPWTDTKKTKITDNVITRGWADPQNYRSLTESEPLVPGQFYEMAFDLQPDDQVLPAGQQIGLMIFSSDRDFTLRPTPGTELTVDLDATSLSLPIVGGQQAFASALLKEE
ncbi:Xaa-Pro dipeptidyl-peptidase [Novipirellula artificiosorum]|uniref:Xaa-Pro dipeptidyl-peptidase n=1 Tax=Novipirellula artificiosorum TaxID=2528016 RepID=A0A5C6DMR7_9BACT|nr:Xaa-Pro dipeptidyl-peptidase [Novipirellula artificiosorum]TWU36159.1 Xaa-Pro dipeptidyl-peptidase [Novipirellula artificiosorum]